MKFKHEFNESGTRATDSVWFNGGKGVEETCFAYVASDSLARILPSEKEKYLNKREKIKRAMLDELWMKSEGHFCFYKDVVGNRLIHGEPWLYSLFYPVNFGIIDNLLAVQSLYYAEYALEHKQTAFGERVYSSNMLPAVWSDRTLSYGEDFQLAEAYFKAGLHKRGFELFKAAYMDCCLSGYVPMNFGTENTSTDFTDITTCFLKCLHDGLFGIRRYDGGKKVDICPAFPFEWENCSLKTADMEFLYSNKGNIVKVSVKSEAENVKIKLPTYKRGIKEARLFGKQTAYSFEEGIFTPYIRIDVSGIFDIEIEFEGEPEFEEEKRIEAKVGNYIGNGYFDPQGALVDGAAAKAGHFTLFNRQNNCVSVIRLDVSKEPEDITFKNPRYKPLDISAEYNGDVTLLFKKEYISPSSNGCSTRLGTDGFSAWTYLFWKCSPPEIDLSLAPEGNIVVGGVPFSSIADGNNDGNNAICISIYDNFPTCANIPVSGRANGFSLLFCGLTNQMQCGVPAARITVFSEEGEDRFSIIPPGDFFGICDYMCDGKLVSYGDPENSFPLKGARTQTVWLGKNCRANKLDFGFKNSRRIKCIKAEAIANETVIAIMGLTLIE